jgi:ribonuclease VapC
VASVVDASSLLAYLHEEEGADVVTDALAEGDCVITIVNWTEALSKWADVGEDPEELSERLQEEGLIGGTIEVVPLTSDDAVLAARLRPLTRHLGLSIADRACVATSVRVGLPALTADTSWGDVEFEGFEARLIR